MNSFLSTVWIEYRKAARSKIPALTLVAYMILPLVCALLMFIYKNPDFARRIGLISAKANLVGGSADWPFFFSVFTQGISVAGLLIFGFIHTWVFGREFSDGTVKDLLAVPISRGVILAAKFLIAALWSLLLTAIILGVGLLLGSLVKMPPAPPDLFSHAILAVFITAGLIILDVTPIAFFASVGRGYLLPIGILTLILALANIVALLGWGSYFPWSIPGVYTGLTGKADFLEAASIVIVCATGIIGLFATYLWWKFADQNR